MALKKFNYKLKENKKKPLIISGIIVLVLLVGVTIYNTYAAYKATTSYNILQGEIKFFEKRDLTIAVKLVDEDGNIEYAEDFPTEGYAYDADKSYCVNGSQIIYDFVNKSAQIKNVNGKDKCTLYFNKFQGIANVILDNNTIVDTTPDFSQSADSTQNTNLYKAEDDFGTSYYFRGNTSNNYVQFGYYPAGSSVNVFSNYEEKTITFSEKTPIYWRIVRINGDGTIRLIYDGTEKVANGTTHINNVSGTAFNSYVDEAFDKYVGYTYDNGNGTQINSTIKTAIDNWYNNYLKTNYGSYIADGVYCNDKEIAERYYYNSSSDAYGEKEMAVIDQIRSYYASYERLYFQKKPTLICSNKYDKYSVNESIGNGYLTNPVGLLTADEVAFAGGVWGYPIDATNYLSTSDFWLLSPHYSVNNNLDDNGYASVMTFGDGSGMYYMPVHFNPSNGTRPVINLKANVEFTGNGSFETPFVIQTN